MISFNDPTEQAVTRPIPWGCSPFHSMIIATQNSMVTDCGNHEWADHPFHDVICICLQCGMFKARKSSLG